MKVTEYKMHVIHAAEPSNIALLETHLDGVYKDYIENLIKRLITKVISGGIPDTRYQDHSLEASGDSPVCLHLCLDPTEHRSKIYINLDLFIDGRFRISCASANGERRYDVVLEIQRIFKYGIVEENHMTLVPNITTEILDFDNVKDYLSLKFKEGAL